MHVKPRTNKAAKSPELKEGDIRYHEVPTILVNDRAPRRLIALLSTATIRKVIF